MKLGKQRHSILVYRSSSTAIAVFSVIAKIVCYPLALKKGEDYF